MMIPLFSIQLTANYPTVIFHHKIFCNIIFEPEIFATSVFFYRDFFLD
jgi:hypothetical protein